MELAWAQGWSGIGLAYAAVQAPMLAGLMRGRAQLHHYFASPTVALPLTAISAGAASLIGGFLPDLSVPVHSAVQLVLGAAIGARLGYTGGRVVARSDGADRIHQRGTVLRETPVRTPSTTHVQRRGADITIAGISVPLQDETKHFKLIGTTGTGKSTAIREILTGALARGDRAVIADPDGGYLREFHDPKRGDVILNPFDPRSVKWDLYGEIENPYDVEQLARSLIPDQGGEDRIWSGYARTFFSAVTRQSHEAGITDLGELYRLLVTADSSELRMLLRGTPGQAFVEEHNERTFKSIRTVTASAVAALEHVAAQKAEPLAVRRWVSSESPGVLFIPYRAGQIAALRSTISAWMRLAIFETMRESAPTVNAARSEPRRLWFVVDELDALGAIDGLKDALARLRKFGGRCVLGFQSVAQVSGTYGHSDAHTIIENCGNTVILRSSASEGGGTARFASQLIGEREVLRATFATSRRAGEWIGSRTRSQHFSVEPALLPSQIEQLPDLSGYFKAASSPHWLRITLPVPPGIASHRERGHDFER